LFAVGSQYGDAAGQPSVVVHVLQVCVAESHAGVLPEHAGLHAPLEPPLPPEPPPPSLLGALHMPSRGSHEVPGPHMAESQGLPPH
jgi:hypothetical protein